MTRTWPADWDARRAGKDCPFCAEGRPSEREGGSRFFRGTVADAYLQRKGSAPGYSIVIFRGRHVADPTQLTADELIAYWAEVQEVAKKVEEACRPCHLNYQILGNAVPHVHVHITPRYLDDPAPERPLMFADRLQEMPDEEYAQLVKALGGIK